jgi:hypothetical protein
MVRQKSGEPYAGVCLNIRRRGIDTSILLRNQMTRVGVEMMYKIYSPNVTGIEVVQRKAKRARRNKLYYMRLVLGRNWPSGHWPLTVTIGSLSMILAPSRISSGSTRDSALCWVNRRRIRGETQMRIGGSQRATRRSRVRRSIRKN